MRMNGPQCIHMDTIIGKSGFASFRIHRDNLHNHISIVLYIMVCFTFCLVSPPAPQQTALLEHVCSQDI